MLSPSAYNRKVGLALLCPITNQVKGYPFEVDLPKGFKVTGTVLSDQIKSLDWRARAATKIAVLPTEIVTEVLDKARTVLD